LEGYPLKYHGIYPLMGLPGRYISLRKAQSNDLKQIADISNTLFREHYTPDFFMHMWEIAPETFIVAEYQGMVIGFILAVNVDIGVARILLLSIKSAYQGQGIGSSLLRMLLNEMGDQIKKISLEVRTDNTRAISFYLHHGFQLRSHLKKFYADGSDGYLMEKKLV
jgi:ribosomal-protein-alanine N-acetyltransferase